MLSFYVLIYGIPLGLVVYLAWSYLRLWRVPGPFLASCTDLWRLWLVRGRKSQETYLQLHQQYGDVVRIGPNCVSVSIPDVVQDIYGIGKGFVKSDFYLPLQNIVNGRRVASLVATTDEAHAAATKRPIAHAYALSTLVEFEPLVDSTTAVFFSRLDELYGGSQEICDMGQWLQFYAFDLIGELTFSKRLGFLQQGKDLEGIIHSVGANFDWFAIMSQMPFLDLCLKKNPIYIKFLAKPIASPVISFGQRRLIERLNPETEADMEEVNILDPELQSKDLGRSKVSKPDFLTRFLALRESQPDVVTDNQLLAYLFMNVNAGSDTVGAVLRAVFYHLLKNPGTLSKLVSDLEAAKSENRLSMPFVTWSETQSIPYLTAVIKEALRIHPALGLPLERVVPSSGLQLHDANNTFLPPGTIVGVNPWVSQRDTRVYGKDADRWNPSRWLDADEAKIKRMDQNLLTFGAGKRTCLGRHIAMLEISKLVPALLMRYDVRLAEPEKEWDLINSWIVRQENFKVILSRRQRKTVGEI